MPSRSAVEGVLTCIRPFLLADGRHIQLVAYAGDDVRVRLTGACADCPSSPMTLHARLEAAPGRLAAALGLVQVA